MKKKKILVDLSILKNVYCGLGQVALNYGYYFKENYSASANYELYLLMPKELFGIFGSEVKYVESNNRKKFLPFLTGKYDVWHAIHQLSKYPPFYWNTKYILTIHDLNFLYEKKGAKIKKYYRRIRRKVNRASKIVCISQFTKDEVTKNFKLRKKKIDVVYNGVNLFDVQNQKKPDFVKNDKPFFFTIGETNAKKNFHVLLPLMKLFPEKELYVAGKIVMPYAQKMLDMIETEKLHNVHLTGTVSNEERTWLYTNCEAFLFPSLLEGFGLPVIEAMSFGKPVFSSKETSLKEIGGDCAFFWDSFDTDRMKEVIDRHLPLFYASPDNAEKNRLYAENFSYAKHMEKYREIYMEMLSIS
ncbi:MAG: glycosyltransferase family 4 protein [Cytophagaceae bacterium]|jgi:glycosyltransferase involved in cell wall biosynthesis|nr:glycosyltransferase family 4 protein [Cytophagaceae bacterium]